MLSLVFYFVLPVSLDILTPSFYDAVYFSTFGMCLLVVLGLDAWGKEVYQN